MPSYSREVKVPGKSAQELYAKVTSDIDRFLGKASLGKFEIERDPAARQVHVVSSMVTATLTCKEGALQLEGKLSLMAAPFRGKLDQEIDKWLTKSFSENA